MDNKYDRYERVVKQSRDITIESKRIIFLLHTIDKESKRDAVLTEAKTRLDNLVKTIFKTIAHELDGQDCYQYLRAYTAGLQEYIEALTFYNYLNDNSLPEWTEVERSLKYQIINYETNETKEIVTMISPYEYILGIADLTGELMRKCINNLASGDINSCYQICNLVKDMYKEFLGCGELYGKEIRRKFYTLKQSLIKMENVCYTVKVRGSEIPKHMLAQVAMGATEEYPAEDDEGYQPY